MKTEKPRVEFNMHIGIGHGANYRAEDDCPCPQQPCGLISILDVVKGCQSHDGHFAKPLRSLHMADNCTGRRNT